MVSESEKNRALDLRLHLERIPPATIYAAEHRLELGCSCIGFVFRNAATQEVALVFDKEVRILNESEARRLMNPPAI